MTILVAIGLGFSILSVLFVRRTMKCTRRGQILRAGGACVSGIASATLAALVAVLVFSYFTYARLTSEQLVSRIEFTRLAPFEFRARLMIEGERDRIFLLTGDEWQLDARLITWKPPATILGLDPIFRLDRLRRDWAVSRHRTDRLCLTDNVHKTNVDILKQRFPYPLLTLRIAPPIKKQ